MSASDRGSLTPDQYAAAVSLARSEIAEEHAQVTTAVATVVAGRIRNPNMSNGCTSGQLLVVSLVGRFPDLSVSPAVGAATGPDTWVTMKADATTGDLCLAGVSLGRFTPAAGAANLVPAL